MSPWRCHPSVHSSLDLLPCLTVTYTSAIGYNARVWVFENWAAYQGTGAATGGSVNNESGGVLGGGPSIQTQTKTITFSQTIIEPILLVNYLGGPPDLYAGDTFNFGTNLFTVLSSHNVTFAGSVISSNTLVTEKKSRALRYFEPRWRIGGSVHFRARQRHPAPIGPGDIAAGDL
jgi:hypothetical protein